MNVVKFASRNRTMVFLDLTLFQALHVIELWTSRFKNCLGETSIKQNDKQSHGRSQKEQNAINGVRYCPSTLFFLHTRSAISVAARARCGLEYILLSSCSCCCVCCYLIISHNQVRGHSTGFSRPGGQKYHRETTRTNRTRYAYIFIEQKYTSAVSSTTLSKLIFASCV